MTMRLYLLQPATVFAAVVNQTSFSYPLTSVEFDTVTTGAYGDLQPGMTVLFGSSAGASDYGRNRVRIAAGSTTLYIGRTSRGVRDGEADLVDGAYITVLNDYRVWAKMPYIDDDGVSVKDEIEYTDENENNYPLANAGGPVFATIDSGIITVDFDAVFSLPIAPGATITGYLWDVDDGSITVGVATDSAITATFPAGFRWVSLTVTDSNANTHTARVPVYARDATSDTTIGSWQIRRHSIKAAGQRMTVRVLDSIPEGTYPDGTLAMVADGEPASAADRTNIMFCGWHMEDPADIGAERTGILQSVDLALVDVAGKLDKLPAFPTSCQIANTPDKWEQMTTPNIDKFIHYILQWHSTALDLADWFPSGVATTYYFSILGTEGQSLWDTVARKARAMVPDRHLTCNTLGQLQIVPDPILQEVGDRTATVQATIGEDDWADIRYQHIRYPRLHWLRSSAVLVNDDIDDIAGVFSLAPGDTPGQGENERSHGEQLAESNTTLNLCAGHRYARENAPESLFTIILAEGADQGIEPADMTWVQLTISTATAAQRGLNFTTERGLPHELSIRYNHGRTGITRTVELKWEREIVGTPAVTYVPVVDPTPPEDDWPDPEYEEPAVGTDFFGDPQYYIVWDEDNVCRTVDVMAAPPTWEKVDTGITGYIIDCRYVGRPNGNETVGMWCLTSDGMWWCDDILATTPSWTNKRSLATIQGVEVAPDDGDSEIRCMANDGGFPGRAILATQPDGSTLTPNANWLHAYFHITHDYGDSWTLCDAADELDYTNSGGTHGHMFVSLIGMDWFRVAGGRIYAVRNSTRYSTGNTVETIIMYSDDLGDTWQKGHVFLAQANNWGHGSILNPHPSATSSLFAISDSTGVSSRPLLSTGTDDGITQVEQANPAGFGGCINWARPNSKHNADTDEHHVMVWMRDNDGAPYNCTLFDSDDGGANWNPLHDSGVGENRYDTPNGWPADMAVWFTIAGTSLQPIVQMTSDYFATGMGTDKEGNLDTVAGGWGFVQGRSTVGGVALPKIGANA